MKNIIYTSNRRSHEQKF